MNVNHCDVDVSTPGRSHAEWARRTDRNNEKTSVYMFVVTLRTLATSGAIQANPVWSSSNKLLVVARPPIFFLIEVFSLSPFLLLFALSPKLLYSHLTNPSSARWMRRRFILQVVFGNSIPTENSLLGCSPPKTHNSSHRHKHLYKPHESTSHSACSNRVYRLVVIALNLAFVPTCPTVQWWLLLPPSRYPSDCSHHTHPRNELKGARTSIGIIDAYDELDRQWSWWLTILLAAICTDMLLPIMLYQTQCTIICCCTDWAQALFDKLSTCYRADYIGCLRATIAPSRDWTSSLNKLAPTAYLIYLATHVEGWWAW